MSNYSPVYTSIWSDIKFTEYTPEQQLIFLYLITNPNCKISGIYQVSPKQISFSTNIDKNIVVDTLKSYDPNTLEYDAAAGIVFIKNHFKFNLNKIGNPQTMIHSLLKSSTLSNHDDFWKEFIDKYNVEISGLIKRIKNFNLKEDNSFLGQYLINLSSSVKSVCKQTDSSLDPDFISISISNKDIINKKEVKKKKIDNGYSDEFEEFWKIYQSGMINTPLGSKKKAYESYKKSKQSPANILEGLKGYLAECEKKGTYTAAVVTFLNQERYNDYQRSEAEIEEDKKKANEVKVRKEEVENIFKINRNSPKFKEIMSTIDFLGTHTSKLFFSREDRNKKIFITDTKFNRDWICSEYGGKIKESLGDCVIIAKEDPLLRKAL
jgi:hypothetical protein